MLLVQGRSYGPLVWAPNLEIFYAIEQAPPESSRKPATRAHTKAYPADARKDPASRSSNRGL